MMQLYVDTIQDRRAAEQAALQAAQLVTPQAAGDKHALPKSGSEMSPLDAPMTPADALTAQ